MPRRKYLSIPTKSPLSHTHRLPHDSTEVSRTLSKLSRSSLIDLALEWLSPRHIALCTPYLQDDDDEDEEDEDAPYTAARSIDELQEIYEEYRQRKGGKKEVVGRIMEGDWRKGITLYQLATADCQSLLNRSGTLRWSAMQIKSISAGGVEQDNFDHKLESPLPRVHAQTFLANLQAEIAPLSKAHYYLTRLEPRSTTLLRIYLIESPYNSEKSLQDVTKSTSTDGASKTLFVLFPDNTPYAYVSHAASTSISAGLDARSLNAIVLEAMSNALSKPRARYLLKPISLSAKSLDTLFSLRGSGRGNTAQGGWSIFIANTFGVPSLDYRKPPPIDLQNPQADKENIEPDPKPSKRQLHDPTNPTDPLRSPSPSKKRRLHLAATRFGLSGLNPTTAPLDRLEIRIADPFPALPSAPAAPAPESRTNNRARATLQTTSKNKRGRKSRPSLLDQDIEGTQNDDLEWRPDVRLSFQGPNVIAGIRALVEEGVVDGHKMPGWMTGEAAVSIGVVKNGRIASKR